MTYFQCLNPNFKRGILYFRNSIFLGFSVFQVLRIFRRFFKKGFSRFEFSIYSLGGFKFQFWLEGDIYSLFWGSLCICGDFGLRLWGTAPMLHYLYR
jgi:hypothetical protein